MRRGRPLPVARLLQSRYVKLVLTSWACMKADRGKITFFICGGYAMWISAATPGGSGRTELWINTSICDHARAVVSIRDPARLVVTCRVGGHVLDFCVLHAPSAHPPQRAEEWWDKTGSMIRTVFRPTLDRVVIIDANGRLGEAPTPLLRQRLLPSQTSCTIGTWRHLPTFEPLPLSTWTSRARIGT